MSSDCSTNFWVGDSYCGGVSSVTISSSSTTTSSPSTTKTARGKPALSGIPCQYNLYYDVVSRDSYSAIEAKFGITSAEILAWNPSVSSDCTSGFDVGYSYCVGVNTGSCPSTSSTITSPPSAVGTYSILGNKTSATQGPIPTATFWPPTPTQSGIISSCKHPKITISPLSYSGDRP